MVDARADRGEVVALVFAEKYQLIGEIAAKPQLFEQSRNPFYRHVARPAVTSPRRRSAKLRQGRAKSFIRGSGLKELFHERMEERPIRQVERNG